MAIQECGWEGFDLFAMLRGWCLCRQDMWSLSFTAWKTWLAEHYKQLAIKYYELFEHIQNWSLLPLFLRC
jgi:hypothetical protein